jgi:hypothetical protein
MNGSALFIGVLNPGERIVWSFQRQSLGSSLLKRFAIVAGPLWFMALMLLYDIFRKGPELPLSLRVELLCGAGWFFILPVFMSWLDFHSARNTVGGC